MSVKADKRFLVLTGLFGAFVFLQFTVLGLANHAGEGYLDTQQREQVYYALQVFVISGFVLYSLFFRFCAAKSIGRLIAYGTFGLFFACGVLLFALRCDSAQYVVVSMIAALCLGCIGGAANLRMSWGTVTGGTIAKCMGLGSAVAVVLQYLLQIRFGATPLLPVFMLAAYGLLVFLLQRHAPAIPAEDGARPDPVSPNRIAMCAVIVAAFILFACFYNEYIHHLQIQSGYSAINAYSWPRLMMVPGYLLFALIGDWKSGKYVPLAALCIMLVMLLNVVLTANSDAYWLNMCLFYFAVAATASYYLLTFWRLAPGTRHPALWAPFGRMLDSAMVLVSGAINLSAWPAPVVLGADIAGVALVIVMMALGGDFNLRESVAPDASAPPSPEETLELVQQRYELSAREAEVLRELVLTEDTNQQIANDLGISRRQLQTHIARIYEKTGTSTRAGLVKLVNEA